ncbi:MAG: hypothetical protein AAGK97_01490 [Bacteroidota bacterium]
MESKLKQVIGTVLLTGFIIYLGHQLIENWDIDIFPPFLVVGGLIVAFIVYLFIYKVLSD